MASKKVTIKDVAREAGVSISTVSNAINGVDVLLPQTRDHVLEVARKLHYVPNLNGRNLKSQETKAIGLFITAIRGPYYSVLADAVYQSCRKNGYDLHIYISDNAQSLITNLFGKRVDGAIVLNEHVQDNEIAMLNDSKIPTVFIDRELDLESAGCVVFNSYHEGELAAHYLIDLGHKRLMHIKGEKKNFDSIERERGFRDVINASDLTLDDDYVLEGLFDKDISYNSIKEFLKKGLPLPDAIFASNDLSAIGVIDALVDSGIRVPEDVSVMGCDDIELTQFVHPSITTIRTSYEKQGTMAVEQLISMLKNDETGAKIILKGNIVPRESTQQRI